MSFLDKLGEKLSDTGKIVSDTTQRAKESGRAISLKKQIRDEEERINKMSLYIMRLYLRDAKEEEFPYPDMLKQVREAEQRITEYYREIELLQMERPTMNPQEADMQGAEGQEQAAAEPVICPGCGREVTEAGNFCGSCGAKIR